MKSNQGNIRFQEGNRKLYGQRFGYAIEYDLTIYYGKELLYFKQKPLVMAEDPQNTKRPSPIDLAVECIYDYAKNRKGEVWVEVYGRQLKFSSNNSLYEIKRVIRNMQYEFISISSEVPKYVRNYIESNIFHIIKDMPIY